jgi:hypothetical protein
MRRQYAKHNDMLKAEALGAAQSIEIALGASSVRNVKDASRMKHNITDDLELLITAMARHQAHDHQCSLAAATRQIRSFVAEAREEYCAAGAPYGDDDQGFCRRLTELFVAAHPRDVSTYTECREVVLAPLGESLPRPILSSPNRIHIHCAIKIT